MLTYLCALNLGMYDLAMRGRNPHVSELWSCAQACQEKLQSLLIPVP